jgi:CheY-like chemotaxis protein
MPGGDGYALMRRVRALPDGRGRRVPALGLTALSAPGLVEKALDAGFDAHELKPLAADKLVAQVASLVSRPLPRPS